MIAVGAVLNFISGCTLYWLDRPITRSLSIEYLVNLKANTAMCFNSLYASVFIIY